MILYLSKRLFAAILTLAAVVLFTLLVFFVLTPDPAVSICGQTCTPERISDIRDRLGLDDPFLTQFTTFVGGLLAGRTYGTGSSAIQCAAPCLGHSFQTQQDVMTMIFDRLPVSLTLAIGASLLWVVVGVTAGLVSAIRAGTWWDKGAMTFALIGIALPNYFVALILQYIFVVQLKILPFPSEVAFTENLLLWLQTYLMPWTVLALMFAAMYARLTRSNVLDTLNENYVRTALAKGLPPSWVLRRHALRPSLTPVATLFGMDFATLLGGAIITETVFGLNGVGKLAYDAISTNDQPVIMGVTLLAGCAVVVANLVVDVLYTVLDPRVRMGGT